MLCKYPIPYPRVDLTRCGIQARIVDELAKHVAFISAASAVISGTLYGRVRSPISSFSSSFRESRIHLFGFEGAACLC